MNNDEHQETTFPFYPCLNLNIDLCCRWSRKYILHHFNLFFVSRDLQGKLSHLQQLLFDCSSKSVSKV